MNIKHQSIHHNWKLFYPAILEAVCAIIFLFMAFGDSLHFPDYLQVIFTFFLVFVLPGSILFDIIFHKKISPISRIPMSFVLSVGLWAIPTTIFMLLQLKLSMLVHFVAITTIVLVLIKLLMLIIYENDIFINTASLFLEDNALIYLGQLIIICVVLTIWIDHSLIMQPSDRWENAGIIRRYLDADYFTRAGFFISEITEISPRQWLNVWLALISVLGKLAQVDIVDLYSFYLPPLLMVVALFSFYVLSKKILHSSLLALFAELLFIIYNISGIQTSIPVTMEYVDAFRSVEQGVGAGFWFRIIEDKYVIIFLILPIVQLFILDYLKIPQKNKLGLVIISTAAIVLLHPLGIAYIGISAFSYTFFHYIIFKDKAILIPAVKIFFVLFVWMLVPLYLTYKMSTLAGLADYISAEVSYAGLIIPTGDKSIFIANFDLISHPYVLLALITFPILLVKPYSRDEASIFLFSNIFLPFLILYNPLLAPIVSMFITPRILWRLILSVPTVLYIAYISKILINYLNLKLSLSRIMRYGICIAILVASLVILQKRIETGFSFMNLIKENAVSTSDVALMRYLRSNSVKNSVILGKERYLTDNISSMVGNSYGIIWRDRYTFSVYDSSLIQDFYQEETFSSFHMSMLERYNVTYVILSPESDLDYQFASMGSNVQLVYENSDYKLYFLRNRWEESREVLEIVNGNRAYKDQDYSVAKSNYQTVLKFEPYNFWANFMLGQIAENNGQSDQAIIYYQNALRGYENLNTMMTLGRLYLFSGNVDEASRLYEEILKQPVEDSLTAVRINRLGGDLFQQKMEFETALNFYSKANAIEKCGVYEKDELNERYLPQGWPTLFKSKKTDFSTWLDDCLAGAFSEHASGIEDNVLVMHDLVRNFNLITTYKAPPEPVHRGILSFRGDARMVLFQHPPSTIGYQIYVDSPSIFSFSPVISPETWKIGYGDGVRFKVWLVDGNWTTLLYSRYIDPKNVVFERYWMDENIDLTPWIGKTITLKLEMDPGPNGDARYDWAGWGEPQITTPIQYDFYTNFSAPAGDDAAKLRQDVLTIGDQTRQIIFQHSTSRLSYSITLPQDPALAFGLGMDPAVWEAAKGDGAEYNIYIDDPKTPGKRYWVFNTYIDPKNRIEDRHWFDFEIKLHQFAGKTVNITFEAQPGPAGDANYDWGGWSTPVIIQVPDVN